MPNTAPMLLRFFTKLVLEILPAGLASIVGGLLFTPLLHAIAPAPSGGQGAPASAQMMQLVGDEHALIVDFLKERLAAETLRLAAEDAARRTAVAIQPVARAPARALAPRRMAAVMAATKPVGSRAAVVTVAVAAVAAPAVSPAPPGTASVEADTPVAPAGRDPHLLVAKTIEIKDRVVGATQRIVAVIGGIPSWIAALGERSSGERS